MPNCANISNSQTVTLTANLLPEGFCHTSLQTTHNTFIANTTGQLSGNNAAFTAGDATPSAQDQQKLWFSLTNACQPGGWKWYNTSTGTWDYVQIGQEQAAPLVSLLATPTGTVSAFAGASAPSGWFLCNGDLKSRSTYSALFAVIGSTYGNGDGSTTFTLPDLRGEFVRGLDGGRAIDADRVLGSAQADDFKSHTHPITAYSSDEPSNGRGIIAGANAITGPVTYTDVRANVRDLIIAKTGGAETRPRNVAMNYIIKH